MCFYLNARLSYKAFVVGLQRQPQARGPSPQWRRTNQQLSGPLFIAVVALDEHASDTQTKSNSNPRDDHGIWNRDGLSYRWLVARSARRASSSPLPHLHRFLHPPSCSGSCWQPGQRLCSPDTVQTQAAANALTRKDTKTHRH